MHFKLAFIGFGTVGQGLTEILLEKKDMLAKKYDFHYNVVAISDIMKGSIYDKNGLDMTKILDLVKKGKKLKLRKPKRSVKCVLLIVLVFLVALFLQGKD